MAGGPDQTRPGQPLVVSELLAGSLNPCKTWDSLACEPVGSAACPAAVSCLPAHSPPLAHHVHNLFTKSTMYNMSTMFTTLFIMSSGHCPPPSCPPYPQLVHLVHDIFFFFPNISYYLLPRLSYLNVYIMYFSIAELSPFIQIIKTYF